MNRVLIVDDKEENLYYLRALLTGHGFDVEIARHGAEALVLARRSPPDLIVSDLLMPVMDGYTLLRHWKSDVRLKTIPFIVYTATYTEAEDERLALNLGADAFILKPTEPDDFLARLREVRDRTAAAAPSEPRHTDGDEKGILKVYSETLIRKLEEKTLQLEDANQALQQDIAERKRAEENLRESEERFRGTFEQAAVGIAHVDVDGKFLRVNDKLCEITGYPREELLKLTFTDLTAPEDRAEGNDARRAVLARAHNAYTLEKRYRRKDGGMLWVNVVTTLLRDSAGEPKYFISVISDITERKVLQDQFLRAQRMESIGTLAGGIAHDLNNLLAPIVMGVDLLKQLDPDPRSLPVIENMARSAKRGTDLVRQVLSFARGVEGTRMPLQAREIVREVESIAGNTFPKNITIETDLAPDLWLVTADPTQLNQVLLNLCVNARDAMPNGGRIDLVAANVEVDEQYAVMNRGASPGRYVVLRVTDNGCGMPKEVVDRIFDPFFTTKELGKGTGLGLSTVLGIVRSHGGFVNVYSEPGKGSVFKIYLPARAETAGAVASGPEAPALPRGNGELVMVVDDETSILDITRQTLLTFGYQVITAEDGAQAIGLYAIHREAVAVVLTDMMMPVMDGPSLIAALHRINPSVKIVAASGLDANGNVARAATAGVNHFLAKPYSAEAMLKMLKTVLADKAGAVRP
ncbi:MAG: response regulator [Opitutaceae bacterium]|jgi:PAS domain S-box-containing protein